MEPASCFGSFAPGLSAHRRVGQPLPEIDRRDRPVGAPRLGQGKEGV